MLTPPPPQAAPAPLGHSAPQRPLPAPYPVQSWDNQAAPEPASQLPVPALQVPETIDFRGAVNGLLPEKKGGPSLWLGAVLVLLSLIGGAVLGHRVTRAGLATALTAAESPRSAVPRATQPSSDQDENEIKRGRDVANAPPVAHPAAREEDIPTPALDGASQPKSSGAPGRAALRPEKPVKGTKAGVAVAKQRHRKVVKRRARH